MFECFTTWLYWTVQCSLIICRCPYHFFRELLFKKIKLKKTMLTLDGALWLLCSHTRNIGLKSCSFVKRQHSSSLSVYHNSACSSVTSNEAKIINRDEQIIGKSRLAREGNRYLQATWTQWSKVGRSSARPSHQTYVFGEQGTGVRMRSKMGPEEQDAI